MAWVGRDLKDHEAPTPPPHTGPPTSTFQTSPGCPGPHPTWPSTPPRMDGASTASSPSLHFYSCPTLTGRKGMHATASDHRLHLHSSNGAETSLQPSADPKTKALHPQGHNHAGNSSAQRNPHESAGGEELCLLAAGPFITEQRRRKKATPSIAPPSQSLPSHRLRISYVALWGQGEPLSPAALRKHSRAAKISPRRADQPHSHCFCPGK